MAKYVSMGYPENIPATEYKQLKLGSDDAPLITVFNNGHANIQTKRGEYHMSINVVWDELTKAVEELEHARNPRPDQ